MGVGVVEDDSQRFFSLQIPVICLGVGMFDLYEQLYIFALLCSMEFLPVLFILSSK